MMDAHSRAVYCGVQTSTSAAHGITVSMCSKDRRGGQRYLESVHLSIFGNKKTNVPFNSEYHLFFYNNDCHGISGTRCAPTNSIFLPVRRDGGGQFAGEKRPSYATSQQGKCPKIEKLSSSRCSIALVTQPLVRQKSAAGHNAY